MFYTTMQYHFILFVELFGLHDELNTFFVLGWKIADSPNIMRVQVRTTNDISECYRLWRGRCGCSSDFSSPPLSISTERESLVAAAHESSNDVTVHIRVICRSAGQTSNSVKTADRQMKREPDPQPRRLLPPPFLSGQRSFQL